MIYVGKSTLPKAGKGLFTTKAIKKGEIVCEYEGERITWAEATRRNDEEDKGGYVFYLTKKNCVDAYDAVDTFGRYANDAAGLSRLKGVRNNSVYEIRKKRVYIVATRNIKAGSEIFVSYGKQYWKVMKEEIELREKEEKKKKRKAKKKADSKKDKKDSKKKKNKSGSAQTNNKAA